MATRIQLRRDTAANWTANAPVLAVGEIGYETDTKKWKIGDGATDWSSLPYQPYAQQIADILDAITAINAETALLDTHLTAGGTRHTKDQVGLSAVLNAEQFRTDLSGYPNVTSPASGDKIIARRASDGAPITIPWSSNPSAAPTMTSVQGVAGTDTIPSLIAADVLAASITARASAGTVSTVNSVSPSAGNVTLTLDDFSDATTNKAYTATEKTKLAAIEASATADAESYTVSATTPTSLTNKITRATGASAKLLVPSTAIQRSVKNLSGGDITVHGPEGIVAAGSNVNGVDFAFAVATYPTWIPATTFNKWTCSFWIRPHSKATSQYVLSTYGGVGTGYIEILYGSSALSTAYIQIDCAKAGGTLVVSKRSVTNIFPTADTWYHVALSIDISTGSPVAQLYVNGSSVSFQTSGTFAGDTLTGSEVMQITGTNLRVNLRGNGAGTTLDAAVAQLYWLTGTAIDLSVLGNLQKFYNSGPVDLGFNGWVPTGTPPNLLMNGDASIFAVNRALLPTASPATATITGSPASPASAISGVSPAGTINGSEYVILADGANATFVRQNGTINFDSW